MADQALHDKLDRIIALLEKLVEKPWQFDSQLQQLPNLVPAQMAVWPWHPQPAPLYAPPPHAPLPQWAWYGDISSAEWAMQ